MNSCQKCGRVLNTSNHSGNCRYCQRRAETRLYAQALDCPERELRIIRYTRRAEKELPLFDENKEDAA